MQTELVDSINVNISTKETVKEAEQILALAKSVTIKTQDQYENAALTLKDIKAKAARLEEERKKITTPLDTAKKAVMDLFRKPTDFLAEAERIIKGSMITYSNEQERLRLEAERKAQEAAKKEEERKGNTEKAEDLRQQAQETFVPAPAVQSSFQKAAGTQERIVWKYKITDVNQIPREWMIPDEKAIGAAIRSSSGKVKIAGIEAYSEKTIAA
jgi:hypothetical protein